MNNRKLIYIFSLSLSLLFSIGYYIVFKNVENKKNTDERTLYMNQVGLYKESKSVENMKETLKSLSLTPYSFKKDDVTVVVTSVYEDKDKTKEEILVLKNANLNYVSKEVVIQDEEIKRYLDSKNYEKVLELIQNKS